jgi:hypothetical protein
MSMPISVSLKNSPLLTRGPCFKATATLIVLICLCAPQAPVLAKDVVSAAAAKSAPIQHKADNSPAQTAADQTAKSKKPPMISDPPVGVKTTDELVKKLSDAYKNKDDVAYLSVLKAPMRTRIRMHQQFKRECSNPVTNFKFITVAQEAARIKAPKDTLVKRTNVNGVEHEYTLPVVGFINYDSRMNIQGPPDVMGIAVGKGNGAYFLVTQQPVEGQAKNTATAAPASALPKAH